jgi:hypothetical protein
VPCGHAMAPARAPQPTRGGSCCRACETRPPAVSIDRRPRGPPRRHPDRWRARTTGARRRHCSADADVDTWWCGSRRPWASVNVVNQRLKTSAWRLSCFLPVEYLRMRRQGGTTGFVICGLITCGGRLIWEHLADLEKHCRHKLCSRSHSACLGCGWTGKSSGRTDVPRRSRTVLPRNQQMAWH